MRIQLILLLLMSSFVYAGNDQEIRDLMENYDRVTKAHEMDLIDDVFSEKFLSDNDGKEEFIEKIRSLPKMEVKSTPEFKHDWRHGLKKEFIFVKLKLKHLFKQKSEGPARGGEFIIIRENGKLKINGTLSDG
jgi:hypothetical protein